MQVPLYKSQVSVVQALLSLQEHGQVLSSFTNTTSIGVRAKQLQRSLDSTIGLGCVSFAEEEVKSVILSFGEAKSVQTNRSVFSSVNTSKINHTLIVNVDPNIIVSSKLEVFSSLVSESRVDFQAKVEVVISSFISHPCP